LLLPLTSQTKLTITVTLTLTDTVTKTSRCEIIYAPKMQDYQKFSYYVREGTIVLISVIFSV